MTNEPIYAIAPLVVAGLIAAGASIAGGYMNWRTNRKNQKLQADQNALDRAQQDKNYERQRADALADWERVNKYNSFPQQMQRLKEAGMNPNFVYGKAADNTAAEIRSSDFSGGNQTAPQSRFDANFMGDAATKYFQTQLMGAQTDNVSQNTQVAAADKALKEAQTLKTLSETELTDNQLDQLRSLKDGVIERQKLENEYLKANTITMLDRNEREELLNSQNVALTTQRILESKLQQLIMRKNIAMAPLEREKLQQEINHLEMMTDVLNHKGAVDRFNSELINKGYNPNMPSYWNELLRIIESIAE